MNHKQKEMNRREMLGCARIANDYKKRGHHEEAAKWNEVAAKRLFNLNGMRGNW